MAENIEGLKIRQRLGRQDWAVPKPWGPDGFLIEHKRVNCRIIVSAAPAPDDPDNGSLWVHASISRADMMPDYSDLVNLHQAVFPDGWSYQVFAPPSDHVNIHPNALHLWGKLDGSQALPNFGIYGTI